MVLVGRGRGGRSEMWMSVWMRMVDAAHVVRVLLEFDERGFGRCRYGCDGSAASAAAGVLAGRRTVVTGRAARTRARTQRGGVHGVTAGHRRRRARGSLLLLMLLVGATAAPSERAPDLSVIQRDGCSGTTRSGGKIAKTAVTVRT